MDIKNKLSADYEKVVLDFFGSMPSTRPKHFFATSKELSLAEGHGNDLQKLLAEHNPARATSISLDMRKALYSISPRGNNGRWAKSTTEIKPILRMMKKYPACVPVFSVSWNGYVREHAVKYWPKINSPFELSLLLIRLNDWVAPVRLAAVKKILSLTSLSVNESGLTSLNKLGCMDLILSPKRFGRCSEIELKALNQLATLQDISTATTEYIFTSSDDSAPRYLKLGLQNDYFGNSLLVISQNGKHADARRIATKTLLSGEHVWKLNGKLQRTSFNLGINKVEIAKYSLDDKSPAVQCIALDYIIDTKPVELFTEQTFRRFVTEKRISIVERAVFGLQSLGIDYINEIREKINAGGLAMHSFDILGRKGTVEDGQIIYALMPKVVETNKTAVLGIAAKLQNSEAIQDLASIAFSQADNNLARAASKELIKVSYIPNLKIILNIIGAEYDVSKRGYLPLIQSLPTMKLAVAIAKLEYIGRVDDLSGLWNTLARKRNTGAFLPSDREVKALANSVKHSPILRDKFRRVLGVKV